MTDHDCIPLDGTFWGTEQLDDTSFILKFSWVNIDNISDIKLYPVEAKEFLANGFDGVKHFISNELQ